MIAQQSQVCFSNPPNMLLQTSWKCLSDWKSHIFREWSKRRLEFNTVHSWWFDYSWKHKYILLQVFWVAASQCFMSRVFFFLLTHHHFVFGHRQQKSCFVFSLQISGDWRSMQQSTAQFPLILPLSTLFRVWSYMTLLSYAYWLEQSDRVPETTWPTNVCMHLSLYACQGQSDSLVHGGETGVPP